jgi:putative oxidoreductase
MMADRQELGPGWEPRMLSILRIMAGLLFMQHGLNKLFDFPPTANHHPYVLLTLVPGLQGLLEAIGGVLLTLGLFTRLVAFILAGDMAAAYFMVHMPKSFFPLLNMGDAAILYCFIFLYLFVAGGGQWSLDRLRVRALPPAGLAARARARGRV